MKVNKIIIPSLLLVATLSLSSCTLLRSATEETTGVGAVIKTEVTSGVTVGPATEVETETKAETETETTAPQETDPYSSVSISFTACGDNLIHPNIYGEAASRDTTGTGYDFKPMYAEVLDIIGDADFAFINQETLMAGEEFGISGYPCFNSPQQLGVDLVDMGFDIISIANNHMLDKSAAGLKATLDFWSTQDATVIGAFYDDEAAKTIPTITADGITIALLSYTYGTNGIVLPAGSELNIPYIDDVRIQSELEMADEIADFVIVSIHWGEENTSEPTDEQKRLASLMANGGADVILGHHSHTLLPIEWIERDDGGKTLCAYSLGNLVSAMMYPENMVGGFLSFSIVGDGEGGLTLDEIRFTPTVFYYGMNHYGTHIYLLENYTAEIAAGHGTQMYGYTTTIEKAKLYLERAIPSEYLPSYLK